METGSHSLTSLRDRGIVIKNCHLFSARVGFHRAVLMSVKYSMTTTVTAHRAFLDCQEATLVDSQAVRRGERRRSCRHLEWSMIQSESHASRRKCASISSTRHRALLEQTARTLMEKRSFSLPGSWTYTRLAWLMLQHTEQYLV